MLTEIPVSTEMGTSTEYTVETAIPVNHVYLTITLALSLPIGRSTYKLAQIMEISFRRGAQLRGSLTSLDGVGSRTISPAWRVCIEWSKSTRWMVPGTAPSVLSELTVMMTEKNAGIGYLKRMNRNDKQRLLMELKMGDVAHVYIFVSTAWWLDTAIRLSFQIQVCSQLASFPFSAQSLMLL